LLSLASAAGEPLTLTVATNNTPMDRKVLEGVASAALERMGFKLHVVQLPSERGLQVANRGEIDGEGLRIAGLDAQYPDLVMVPERFMRIQFVAFSHDSNIKLPNGWDDLKNYRVAHITGWKLFEGKAASAKSSFKVDRAEQLFQMLDAHRIDLALYTLPDGQALASQMELPGIRPVLPALSEADMYLYLHKRHHLLAPKLAQTLRDMKKDGSYNQIVAVAAKH
jgi:polar amino acid transport system substrate-binding protein